MPTYFSAHKRNVERVWMVQTESQYICIHQCLLTVLEGKESTNSISPTHVNQGYEGMSLWNNIKLLTIIIVLRYHILCTHFFGSERQTTVIKWWFWFQSSEVNSITWMSVEAHVWSTLEMLKSIKRKVANLTLFIPKHRFDTVFSLSLLWNFVKLKKVNQIFCVQIWMNCDEIYLWMPRLCVRENINSLATITKFEKKNVNNKSSKHQLTLSMLFHFD